MKLSVKIRHRYLFAGTLQLCTAGAAYMAAAGTPAWWLAFVALSLPVALAAARGMRRREGDRTRLLWPTEDSRADEYEAAVHAFVATGQQLGQRKVRALPVAEAAMELARLALQDACKKQGRPAEQANDELMFVARQCAAERESSE